MNYYVVSEEELERLHSTAFAEGVVFCGEEGPDYDYDRWKSDDNSNLSMAAACTRLVPEWATEFAGEIPDGEYPEDACWSVHRRLKEIKRD